MKKLIIGAASVALTLIGVAAVHADAPTLVLSGGNAVFGADPAVITATASVPGSVAFSAAGKVITGCEAIATTTETPFVAKCSWTPAAAGATALTGVLTPTDATLAKVNSPALNVKVGVPIQGVVSPIHIYVDTILASGPTGVMYSKSGVTCAITNQFILGQTIVFRVYANNADQGGAVMDNSNTKSAYVTIAGVKDPLQLTYGNHGGVAFWTAPFFTGTGKNQYSTLGLINFKVTFVAKDSSTMKVLSTKLVPRKVNGVRQVDANGRTIYDRVSYYRTVTVSPPLAGATGSWSSNFNPNSQLTLYAVPTA